MGQGASSPSFHSPTEQLQESTRGSGQWPRFHLSNTKEEEEDDDDEETGADLTLLLPDECLSSIFAKLGAHDRNSCTLVCKRWNLVDSKTRQRLALAACSELSSALPSLLSRFESVSVLSLKCSRKLVSIDDAALCLIARSLTSLKKLKLKGCVEITDDGLAASSLLLRRSLRKLSCSSCIFTSTGIGSVLSRCTLLQDLTLKRLRKLDASQQVVELVLNENGAALALQRLCLKDLHNARVLAPILAASAKSLKTLIICRSSGMWDAVLDNLRRCSLSEIQVENLQLSDTGLFAVSSACPDLEVFYISRPSHCTDVGFSAIAASCRKLRKLHIDAFTKFGNQGVGDDGVVSIATRCSLLQEVVLMGVPLTVLSLDALASHCPALERMALCNIDSVGDPELGFVAAKFSALRKLCIKNCPISDAGVAAIAAGCPNLVKLKVKRCRDVTHANVYRLRQQRESLVFSLDVESLSLAGEEMVAEERGIPDVQGGGRRPQTARLHTTSTRTHLVCGSRGANLIRARMLRKPSVLSASSSRTAHR